MDKLVEILGFATPFRVTNTGALQDLLPDNTKLLRVLLHMVLSEDGLYFLHRRSDGLTLYALQTHVLAMEQAAELFFLLVDDGFAKAFLVFIFQGRDYACLKVCRVALL